MHLAASKMCANNKCQGASKMWVNNKCQGASKCSETHMIEQEFGSSSLNMVLMRLKESLKLYLQLLLLEAEMLLSIHNSVCLPVFLCNFFANLFGSTLPVTVTFCSLKSTSNSSTCSIFCSALTTFSLQLSECMLTLSTTV